MNGADEAVEIRGEQISVRVRPLRGAEITFVGAPDGPNMLFFADWSTPVRASVGGSYGSAEDDWLSEWRGGWQELFPNAGAPSAAWGVPLPFHGEASTLPWEIIEHRPDLLSLRCACRLPVTLTRTMRIAPDRPTLFIEEVASNESDLPVPVLWAHHPAFDAVPGSRVDLPTCRIVTPDGFDVCFSDLGPGEGTWPFAAGRDRGRVDLSAVPPGPTERVVYLTDLPEHWAALRRPDRRGLAMAWDGATFPHAWMWTEIGGSEFPWYGRSRVLAVEPASSWPNDGLEPALARGQGHTIPAHARLSSWLSVSLFDDDGRPVTSVAQTGAVRRGT